MYCTRRVSGITFMRYIQNQNIWKPNKKNFVQHLTIFHIPTFKTIYRLPQPFLILIFWFPLGDFEPPTIETLTKLIFDLNCNLFRPYFYWIYWNYFFYKILYYKVYYFLSGTLQINSNIQWFKLQFPKTVEEYVAWIVQFLFCLQQY